MELKPEWPQILQGIMGKSWSEEPQDRPAFRDVAGALSRESNPVIYAALAPADDAVYAVCDPLVATTDGAAANYVGFGAEWAEYAKGGFDGGHEESGV